MIEDELRRRLDAQDWRCCYPCAAPGEGGEIKPGDELALCFDAHGICHARCAAVGVAPGGPDPVRVTFEFDMRPALLNPGERAALLDFLARDDALVRASWARDGSIVTPFTRLTPRSMRPER